MTNRYFIKMLVGCIIFTNKCISEVSCKNCRISTFNNISSSSTICLGDSKHICALNLYLGPIMDLCQRDCEPYCDYYNPNDADTDPCLASTVFCKMCGNKPRAEKEDI